MGVDAVNRMFQGIFAQRALLVPAALLGMLAIVVVPMPPALMDLLIAANLTLAALVLLTAVLVQRPLDFSVFPSLLLATTLFRLSLNVATTRMILTADAADPAEGTAAAGKVIESFAGFVSGDSIFVGAVLFAILVVIQFVVITKGSERISEVAARFVLDALPGKQMAIDSELAAGFIDKDHARLRREELSRETDFYGSMDGASKFVRGDAMAGLIITLVNIVGGLAVGVFEKGWTVSESAAVFTRLTIGDGLVSQLPAVIVAVAAGMIITRSSQRQQLGAQLTGQIGSQWIALAMASGFLCIMAFTGLPAVPMLALAVVLAGLAYWSYRQSQAAAGEGEPDASQPEHWLVTSNRALPTAGHAPAARDGEIHAHAARGTQPPRSAHRHELPPRLLEAKTHATGQASPSLLTKPPVAEPLTLELGLRLTALVKSDSGQAVLPRLDQLRHRVADRLGWVAPSVVVRDDWQLAPRQYRVCVRGQVVAEGQVYPGRLFVRGRLATSDTIDDGVPRAADPVTREPAAWVSPESLEDADRAESALAVLMRHLEDVVLHHAHELLSREATAELVDQWREHVPRLCDDVLGPAGARGPQAGRLRISELHRVLQNLLREQVSIADIETVLEVLGDWVEQTTDPDVLTEYVRLKLARTIVGPLMVTRGREQVLRAVRLTPRAEGCAVLYLSGQRANMSAPDVAAFDSLVEQLRQAVTESRAKGVPVALVVPPAMRRLLRDELEKRAVACTVIADAEVPPGFAVEVVAEYQWRCDAPGRRQPAATDSAAEADPVRMA